MHVAALNIPTVSCRAADIPEISNRDTGIGISTSNQIDLRIVEEIRVRDPAAQVCIPGTHLEGGRGGWGGAILGVSLRRKVEIRHCEGRVIAQRPHRLLLDEV